jgi:hypothetical protein
VYLAPSATGLVSRMPLLGAEPLAIALSLATDPSLFTGVRMKSRNLHNQAAAAVSSCGRRGSWPVAPFAGVALFRVANLLLINAWFALAAERFFFRWFRFLLGGFRSAFAPPSSISQERTKIIVQSLFRLGVVIETSNWGFYAGWPEG